MATNADKAARAVAGRAAGTEVVPRTAYEGLKQTLERSNEAFLRALTGHAMTVEGFQQAVLNVTIQNPEILNCDPKSIVGAALICATTGLHPGPEGYAHIVPYRERTRDGQWITKAQFQFGYPGLLKLVYESGRVTNVLVEAVYEGDIFGYTLGTDPKIHHEPSPDAIHDEEHMTHVYSVLFLRDAPRPSFRVMTQTEVNRVRSASKGAYDRDGNARSGSPWHKHYVEMARKTVLRNHMKTEYLGDHFAHQLDQDEKTVVWDERLEHRIAGDITVAPDQTDWEQAEAEAEPAAAPEVPCDEPCDAVKAALTPEPAAAPEEAEYEEELDPDDAATLANMVKAAEETLDGEVVEDEPGPPPKPPEPQNITLKGSEKPARPKAEQPKPAPVPQPQAAPQPGGEAITEQVLKGLAMTLKNMGVSEATEQEWLAEFGVTSKKDLSKAQGLEMIKRAGRHRA